MTNRCFSRCYRLLLFTLGLWTAPAMHAGVFSINTWTNDASSGIVPGQTVWAYHFGVTNVATVNGVTVPGVGTNGNPAVAGQFSVTGIPFVFLNDNNLLTALTGSGSAVMARNFIYGGAPGRITVEGLTTGQVYTVSIYGVSFDPPTTRASNFTNGTDTIYVNENASPTRIGVRVDYTFMATATTNLTLVMPTNANTFHTYGLALRKPLVVTTTSDSGPGSLRQAVLDAAALPGADTITFAPALSGATILLTTGAVTLNNSLTIDGSALPSGITINGNGTSGVFVINGGATVVLTALNIANGNSSYGGGVLNDNSTATLNRCTLTGNAADNSAAGGGGIANNQGTMNVIQCTLYGNHATNSAAGGGGILNYLGTMNVIQCTIYGNSGSYYDGGPLGGGIRAIGPMVVGNSIVAGNMGEDIFAFEYTSTGGNFIGGNPMLAPLGNYGGPTQTMPPLPGSPAMDAANVVAGLATDQRGSARVSGAAPDIGAVESSGLWVQNTTDAGVDSLRSVLFNAGVGGLTNVIVNFVPSLSGATITLTSEITLNSITIDASSLPAGITISGGDVTRLFSVGSSQTVTLRYLNLVDGQAAAGSGGALNNAGILTVDHCSFASSGATYGGAIANDGNLTIRDSTLNGNTATGYGGAIFNDDTLEAIHCTFADNQANISGGALSDNNGNETFRIKNCTIVGNRALDPDGGGALDCYALSSTTLGTTILSSNTANGIIRNYAAVGSVPPPLTSTGYNLCDDSPSGLNATGDLINIANALLAPLGNYGGPTQTMPPLPGSPAINAAGTSSFTTDQRGYPRPVGLAADIGAVEGIYNAAGPGTITNFTRLANGTMRLSFTNLTDASFPVVATTNISQPLSNWTVIGYAAESAAGNRVFQFTDADAAKFPQRYYRVKSP